MHRKLTSKLILISLLFFSFMVVPIACSSKDDSVEITPDPEPEPDPVADPTNVNTTIKATPPEGGVTLTSTITVQLAESDGTLMTISGGTVALTITGSSNISAVTDNGNGTYSATLSSNIDETVIVTGTLNGVAISNPAVIIFNPDESNPAQEVVQATEPVGPSILRINSGGPEVTYGDIVFLADQYFEGITESYTNPFVTEIAETDMDEIYLTERVTRSFDILTPFNYKIPVTNGTYTVKFYFAEIYWGVENQNMLDGGDGSRVFDLSMEDVEIFRSYDIHKEVGAATATSRMYNIEVTDGELNISFRASKDRPKVSAIEIFGNGTIGL